MKYAGYFPCDLVGGEYFEIGDKSIIAGNSVLEAIDNLHGCSYTPVVKIGKKVNIGEYFNLTAVNSIEIGNNVLIGRWVTIKDNSHGSFSKEELDIAPIERKVISKGGIFIEDNVWICDKVTICSGVHIGKGSVIAANAVVTKDVPPYSLAGGVPAKIIKHIE